MFQQLTRLGVRVPVVQVLADAAIKIEDHYSQLAGERRSIDIEWTKNGPDGEIYIVQARPETAISQRNPLVLEEYMLGERDFELHEENPMIGFRGAARYIHPAHAEGFALECTAMLQVCEVACYLVELGVDSISLTPDRVLQTMQAVQEIEAARGLAPRA